MYPPVIGMQQLAQGQGQQPAAQDDSSSSSDESGQSHGRHGKYSKDDSGQLTRSATFLWKLPLVRLQQMVEAACPELDASAIATTTAADLARLLYIFAKLQPHTRCSNLQSEVLQGLDEVGVQSCRTCWQALAT